MRKDKVKVYELRRQGMSYKQIRNVLGVPLGTISAWLKNEAWSVRIRNRLGAMTSLAFPEKIEAIKKANRARWEKLYQEYRDAGEKEFEILKNKPLFLAGVMLYWGEGSKSQKDSHLRFCNSDPAMIKIFYRFLIKAIGAPRDKIKAHLILYPDLIDEMQKSFWSKATGIPLSQFRKSTYIQGRHPARRLSYGVCTIYISNRELKEKILTWIRLYSDNLV
jgi:hypothetical protein